MQISISVVLGCVLLILSACSNKPKELLAPCNWDHRTNCGSIIALSHQDQL